MFSTQKKPAPAPAPAPAQAAKKGFGKKATPPPPPAEDMAESDPVENPAGNGEVDQQPDGSQDYSQEAPKPSGSGTSKGSSTKREIKKEGKKGSKPRPQRSPQSLNAMFDSMLEATAVFIPEEILQKYFAFRKLTQSDKAEPGYMLLQALIYGFLEEITYKKTKALWNQFKEALKHNPGENKEESTPHMLFDAIAKVPRDNIPDFDEQLRSFESKVSGTKGNFEAAFLACPAFFDIVVDIVIQATNTRCTEFETRLSNELQSTELRALASVLLTEFTVLNADSLGKPSIFFPSTTGVIFTSPVTVFITSSQEYILLYSRESTALFSSDPELAKKADGPRIDPIQMQQLEEEKKSAIMAREELQNESKIVKDQKADLERFLKSEFGNLLKIAQQFVISTEFALKQSKQPPPELKANIAEATTFLKRLSDDAKIKSDNNLMFLIQGLGTKIGALPGVLDQLASAPPGQPPGPFIARPAQPPTGGYSPQGVSHPPPAFSGPPNRANICKKCSRPMGSDTITVNCGHQLHKPCLKVHLEQFASLNKKRSDVKCFECGTEVYYKHQKEASPDAAKTLADNESNSSKPSAPAPAYAPPSAPAYAPPSAPAPVYNPAPQSADSRNPCISCMKPGEFWHTCGAGYCRECLNKIAATTANGQSPKCTACGEDISDIVRQLNPAKPPPPPQPALLNPGPPSGSKQYPCCRCKAKKPMDDCLNFNCEHWCCKTCVSLTMKECLAKPDYPVCPECKMKIDPPVLVSFNKKLFDDIDEAVMASMNKA